MMSHLAHRRTARWRRPAEIRQDCQLALTRLRALREDGEGTKAFLDHPDRPGVTSEKWPGTQDTPVHSDVLGQVVSLLRDLDTREREYWSEEDTRILLCFQEAWTAAAHKGYTLQDLQSLLIALRPDD
jgi:hypothetical protein